MFPMLLGVNRAKRSRFFAFELLIAGDEGKTGQGIDIRPWFSA